MPSLFKKGVDLLGNRALRVGDPLLGTDGANKDYADGLFKYAGWRSWHAAVANRNNRTVHTGILGASVVEGYPASAFARTIAQMLADNLRQTYPVTDQAGGGRGFIGCPSSPMAGRSPYMWPTVYTGGAFDENTYYLGRKRSIYVIGGTGSAITTVAEPVTSFKINHVRGPAGNATGGYWKVDGGTATTFSTLNATSLVENLLVTLPAGSPARSTIEVGWSTGGYLFYDGITESAGDEAGGFQVHNLGHAGYTIAQWSAGSSTAGGALESIATMGLDVLILQDLGVNDGSTGGGNISAATFKTQLIAFIALLRAKGITCPILLAATYDVSSQVAMVSPWADYVTAQREVADADSTIRFVDHSVRMPPTNASDIYGLYDLTGTYGPARVHSNVNGAGHQFMADTLAAQLAAA